MNGRVRAALALAVGAVLLVGCTPKDPEEGLDATSATAAITKCERQAPTSGTVNIEAVVRGSGDYAYLVLAYDVQDRNEVGKVVGSGTVRLSKQSGRYAGSASMKTGRPGLDPVCVVTDVRKPNGTSI